MKGNAGLEARPLIRTDCLTGGRSLMQVWEPISNLGVVLFWSQCCWSENVWSEQTDLSTMLIRWEGWSSCRGLGATFFLELTLVLGTNAGLGATLFPSPMLSSGEELSPCSHGANSNLDGQLPWSSVVKSKGSTMLVEPLQSHFWFPSRC
ncbi:hypothetical protein NPIL_422031 [Nephila pilipes]|uniref:Uncharacterized protein n=1 Tax=Nephila pilipes TaxID=299642 RepID=A0A8X6MBG2_NEPPI|nr:hypothetical protein NPIL_422031 [Nephila pilipes]